MTVPTIETPLRAVTHSKAFRTGGLALLLVVDIVIIVWMSSSRPGPTNFLTPLQAPFTAEQTARDTAVLAGERRAPTVTKAPESERTVETTVSSGSTTAAAATPDRLLEFLGASAKPPFLRTGTPVRPGVSASSGRSPGTVSASGRRGPALVQAPGLPAGVLIPSPSAPTASPAPTLASILAPQPSNVQAVAAATAAAGQAPAPAPANEPPPLTQAADPRPAGGGGATAPSVAAPDPDPTPDEPTPSPTRTLEPAPKPAPKPDPTPEPVPSDPPAEPAPTATATTEVTEPTSEPTTTATKTPKPRCTTPPCGANNN